MRKTCEATSRMLFLVGAAAICLPASSGSAQDASTTQLDEISVEGRRQGTGVKESPTGPVRGYVARRTFTGSKTDTPILEIPQSVSVITADQISDRAAQNVGEALNYSAGVIGQPWGNDPRSDSPIIRGFDASESMYLNGLKLLRPLGMTALEPYGMERIEVLRGPSSVLYGQGNPGGMINYVSKRPVWERFGEVRAEAATFDRISGAFDFGGPIVEGSDVAYRVTGLVRDGGTQMDHVRDDRYFFAPALTWKPNDATSLTVLASVQHDHAGTVMGLPVEYTLLAPSGERLSRSKYLGESQFNKSDRTFATIGYEFSHEFADGWTFRQNARYARLDWEYNSLSYSGLNADDPTLANRGTSLQDEKFGTLTADSQFQKEFVTGPLSHTVLAGLDFRRHTRNTSAGFGSAPPISITDPEYGVDISKDVWFSSKIDGVLLQTGVYVQDQVRLDKWLLTLGLRHDWASAQSDTESTSGISSQDQKDTAWTYRVGLTYLFENGLAPYASYSTSFEPVLGNFDPILGGEAFKPSEGEQYELGVKFQPFGWNAFLTAAVYDLTQTNVSSTTVIDDVSYTVQTGEVHVKGVELAGQASLNDGLKLLLNYAYMDAEITRGVNGGNRPANVPKHAASAWLDYTLQTGHFAGFGFGAGARYVGSRYDVIENRNLLPSNTLFDAAIHYERGPVKASVNVNNIADKKYVASCGYFGCQYGDGRTVIGRIAYRW